jgi:hypothetical protein
MYTQRNPLPHINRCQEPESTKRKEIMTSDAGIPQPALRKLPINPASAFWGHFIMHLQQALGAPDTNPELAPDPL